MSKSQLETGRRLALACVFLLLVFTSLEATHIHGQASSLGGASSSCALCVSAHGNAMAITFVPLPVPMIVEAVAAPLHVQLRGLARELRLFIRPPPSV